ncbi:glycerophosphoinositol inositolphosphodiesterase GDPD2 [Pogona vitticeps]
MDSSTAILKKAGVEKSKSVPPDHLVQENGHLCFIICLAGFYSCHWKWYQRPVKPGQCCCGKGECIYFVLLLLTFSSWFTFLYMWGEAKNDYHNFDGFAYGNLGFWFQWSTFLLFLASFFFSYILLLLIVALCLLLESQQLYLHWCHKTAMFFFLFISAIGLTLITLFWRRQWNTFYLSFQITAPFLHMGAIFTMTLLAWPVALHFFRMENRVLQMLILSPYLAILIFLFFIPMGMYSPCIREEGTLGPKPALIGHRGAPMVAPENTEMSFLKTVEYGASGFETDVTISFDGVPFLMHDKTLKRTTNVEDLYPAYLTEEAAMFPWEYLEKLNSGNWFFEKRPFFGMPPLSPDDRKWARRQKIFKFSDFLKLANKENKYIIFDLYRPPKYHPYRNNYLDRLLQVIQDEARIRPDLVLWLYNPNRNMILRKAPKFQQTGSSAQSIQSLKEMNIVKLNLDYRKLPEIDIRKYAEANITINLWVVSEPWLFSLVWCYGAHSVTTNAVHTLGSIEEPYFLMTPQEYKTMWIITSTVSILFISVIFGIFWWKAVGRYRFIVDSSTSLEGTGSLYSIFKAVDDKMPTVV